MNEFLERTLLSQQPQIVPISHPGLYFHIFSGDLILLEQEMLAKRTMQSVAQSSHVSCAGRRETQNHCPGMH